MDSIVFSSADSLFGLTPYEASESKSFSPSAPSVVFAVNGTSREIWHFNASEIPAPKSNESDAALSPLSSTVLSQWLSLIRNGTISPTLLPSGSAQSKVQRFIEDHQISIIIGVIAFFVVIIGTAVVIVLRTEPFDPNSREALQMMDRLGMSAEYQQALEQQENQKKIE